MTTLKDAAIIPPGSWVEVPLPGSSGPPLARPSLPGYNPLSLGPVPSTFGTDPDAQRSFYRPGTSQSRIPPLPTQSKLAGGAQAQSTVIVQARQSTTVSTSSGNVGGIISLQVNSVLTPIQTILNLLSGVGIAFTANAAGGVEADLLTFGPSGPNHSAGGVPDPGSSAGTTKYLREDGTFQVPPGTGGAAFYQTIEEAGTPVTQQPTLNFLAPFVVTNNGGNTSTDISISTTTIQIYDATTLNVDVAVPASTIQQIMSSLVLTMPSTGGPWRIQVAYEIYVVPPGGNPLVEGWVTDNSNIWATSRQQSPNNFNVGTTALSDVMYANGASVTLQLMVGTDSNITCQSASSFSLQKSWFQAAVYASN